MEKDLTPNIVARQLQFVCRWILECVAPLSEEQLRWQPSVTAPSIRFHLFHVARCGDIVQYRVAETAGQVWTLEHVAGQWDLRGEDLGLGEHGATLGGEAAMLLPLPEKQRLLDYAERAIVALDGALSRVDDAEFQRIVAGYGGEAMAIGELVVDQLEHMGRHLGMIEAMLGFQGLEGTATI